MEQVEHNPEEKPQRGHLRETVLSEAHFITHAPRMTLSIGILVIGIIYFFLPEQLRFGPGWVLCTLEVLILLPLWIFWFTGHALSARAVRGLHMLLLILVTGALAIALFFLIGELKTFTNGFALLRTAGLLWIFNILVFAFWYWEMDGGGPRKRHEAGHQAVDLLFPQQVDGNSTHWAPDFFDYLFVAFTGATAFSPTDTYPLTHRTKALMMIEGMISLTIVAILIGRVANIF